MRRLNVGLVVVLLVALALSIGVNIGLMLGTQQSGGSPSPTQAQPTASALSTEPPTPTPIPTAATPPAPQTTTITDQNVTAAYSEHRRHTNPDGTLTTITLSVDAQHSGEAVTLDLRRFQLSIMTSRGGLEPYPIYLQSGIAYPAESGTVTIGGDHPEASFMLTFEFSTLQQTSMGGLMPFHGYELRYV